MDTEPIRNSNESAGPLSPHATRANLAVGANARRTHDAMVAEIDWLLEQTPPVASGAFTDCWGRIMELLARYQDQVVAAAEYTVSCSRGCSACCFHWVEDVYSFEAELIAAYIKQTYPRHIPGILKRFAEDEDQLIMLQEIVDRKLAESGERGAADIDSVDLLLASFYQLQRPCALLSTDGACGIYPVRPLTCRIYMSFSNPKYCKPEFIHDDEIRTYLLDMEEEASEKLDRLHAKYDRFDGDTGLRSVLKTILSASD